MKSRNLSLLFIFVFCLLVVTFCQSSSEEITLTQTQEELEKLIHVSADVGDLFDKEAKDNLINEIMSFREEFKEYFGGIGLDSFPKSELITLLGDKHVILEDVTEIYHSVSTGDQYCRLLRQMKEEKARSLTIAMQEIGIFLEFKHITVDKIEESRVDHKGEPLNMIARVVFKYHINRANHPLPDNQAGGGSGEFLHRRVCTWF